MTIEATEPRLKLHAVIDATKKKECVITIGNATFTCALPKGEIEIDLHADDVFHNIDTMARLKNILRALAVEKRFDFMVLAKYLANADMVRMKQLSEILNIPPYIAKVIITTCLRHDGLVPKKHYYEKTAEFAESINKYELARNSGKERFIPVVERQADTKTVNQESWEGWALKPDGLMYMTAEKERIEKNVMLKRSIRKRLLGIADHWIKVKQNRDKEMRPKKSERERMKEIIEEEMRDAEAFDKTHGKPQIPEYNDDEAYEDPSIVRRHFRKKKPKK